MRKTMISIGTGGDLPSNALGCIGAVSPHRNQEVFIKKGKVNPPDQSAVAKNPC
jgi:hypothetical protein